MTAVAQEPRDAGTKPAHRPTLRVRAQGGALRLGSAMLSRLPEGPLVALAEASGELWYRVAPARAAQGRLNLQRVCSWLVEHDMATDRVRVAATDPEALERLLRLAFRHAARYYLEVARAPALNERVLTDRLVVETPDIVERALDGGAVIIVGLHFGAIELPAAYFALRTGLAVTIPM